MVDLEAKIREIIKKAPNETDHWDFKAEWHKNNGELLCDIINFTNTIHHDDCYLILGISDEDGTVIGVEGDKNRKNRQKLQDFLRTIPFASNSYPLTDVNTLHLQECEIDVITIFDTNKVPYYLQHTFQKQGSKVPAGLIYSRINDSNTPMNESTSGSQMELLWRKRLHLDQTIQEKFWFELSQPERWSSIRDDEKHTFILNSNPDFVVEIVSDTEGEKFEALSYSQMNHKIGWDTINLRYRGVLIHSDLVNYLDGARLMVCSPEIGTVEQAKSGHRVLGYYCYVPEKWSYTLTNFLFCRQHIDQGSAEEAEYAMERLREDVVWYNSAQEKTKVELYFKNHAETEKILHAITPTQDKLDSARRIFGQGAEFIEQQHLISTCINEYILPIVRGN